MLCHWPGSIFRSWRPGTPTTMEYWTFKSSPSFLAPMKKTSNSCLEAWTRTMTVRSSQQFTAWIIIDGVITSKRPYLENYLCHALTSLSLSLTVCDWWMFAGQIDAAEIQHSLHTIGVEVSLEDATRILQRFANRSWYLIIHINIQVRKSTIYKIPTLEMHAHYCQY